ncbi:Peptidase family S41 [Marivirga sericea]|uniref:Peptidase family S41 n=2 Tax=Marivirga sericea TaxID=1028 RepID=A0A1X7L3H2_9BACT|nr:Peptidase family S41 [Marivirga sericea]
MVLVETLSSFGQSDSAGFKSDLRIFQKALEETHPNLYRFTAKAKFDTVFDSIDQKITPKTTELEFFRLLSKIESLVREGHTYLLPSESLTQQLQTKKLFPFEVTISDSIIVVKESFDKKHSSYKNREINAINGEKSEDIINQIANSTGLKSGYNNSALLNILSFENNFAFSYYYFIDTTSTFQIHFENEIVAIPGIDNFKGEIYPKFPKECDPPFALQIDSLKRIAIIKITTFAYWTVSSSKKEYAETFSKYFSEIEKAGIKYLIIDVRDNRGGEEMLAAELLTYLVKKDFRIYKSAKANTLDFKYDLPNSSKFSFRKKDYIKTDSGYFKIQDKVLKTFSPKSKNHFDGQVYVLSNGGSRSAASILLSLIRFHNIGIIVGQESGGVFEDVDGRKKIKITLPYSKIQLSFPAWSFKIDVEGGDRFRGVMPDYIVKRNIRDTQSNKDPELDLVYKLISDE